MQQGGWHDNFDPLITLSSVFNWNFAKKIYVREFRSRLFQISITSQCYFCNYFYVYSLNFSFSFIKASHPLVARRKENSDNQDSNHRPLKLFYDSRPEGNLYHCTRHSVILSILGELIQLSIHQSGLNRWLIDDRRELLQIQMVVVFCWKSVNMLANWLFYWPVKKRVFHSHSPLRSGDRTAYTRARESHLTTKRM